MVITTLLSVAKALLGPTHMKPTLHLKGPWMIDISLLHIGHFMVKYGPVSVKIIFGWLTFNKAHNIVSAWVPIIITKLAVI